MNETNAVRESKPVRLADDVFWVGFIDEHSGLRCNPYLIIDGDEALLIDGGSRPDFPEVMMKILQTGIRPENIRTLVYQHYDPDLCGSIPNLEDLIDRSDLRIISHSANNVFIRHYSVKSRLLCMEALGGSFTFRSGRRLHFVKTPYAHSAGSFATFDEKSRILFTSDLFGAYAHGAGEGDFFLEVSEACHQCADPVTRSSEGGGVCDAIKAACPLIGVFRFHRKIMTSNAALRHALKALGALDLAMIAPQHGSVIADPASIDFLFSALLGLDDVGIDGVINAEE